MKLLVVLSILFVFLLIPIQDSFSELEISTNSKVYSPEHTLQVYGTGLPGENLILRLFAPDESITKFEQIQTESDGSFNHQLLTWPIPSSGTPYGTYVVEVLSTEQNGLSKKIDITFSSTTAEATRAVGSVMVTDAVSSQLFASVTVTTYVPAARPVSVADVPPELHAYEYVVVPPEADAVASPSAPPLQETF